MKKYNLLIALLVIACSVFAQKPDSTQQKVDSVQAKINKLVSAKDSIKAADTVRYWKKGGMIGINFTQSSFTNWAAGGENAVSATGLVNLFANYKRDKTTWDNNLDLAYGLLQSGTAGIRKNEDKIEFSSKYGRYAFLDHWYYSALLSFKSQFDNGYNTRTIPPSFLILWLLLMCWVLSVWITKQKITAFRCFFHHSLPKQPL